MFKGNKKYLYVFVGIFVLIIAVQYVLPKPINWNRTYLRKDKAPFGCYAIHNLMDGVYADTIVTNNQTLYNLKNTVGNNASIILVNDKIDLNKSDIQSLFEILKNGNSVFIAANDFNGILTDTFHLSTRYDDFYYYTTIDSLINKPGGEIRPLAKNLSSKTFTYSQVAWVSSFETFDSTRFSVLALSNKERACLISTQVGKGKLYLMTVPDVFGNYYIVNNKNRELAYLMLSLLKNKKIVWDEYYKTFNVSNYSFLRFILESDALYSAYLLLVLSIILYMITEGRRRQRAIPILEPVTNTTLEFVNVISHVYYSDKNHKNIAAEKIKYFYESIRKRFNITTNDMNDELFNTISDLSGVEYKLVKQLFVYCEKLKTTDELSEYDLIELNRQITNFNKNSLR